MFLVWHGKAFTRVPTLRRTQTRLSLGIGPIMNTGKPAQWREYHCAACGALNRVRNSAKKYKYCSSACFGKGTSTLPDKETLTRLYWWDEWSHQQIAERYGVQETAVQSRFKRMGIPSRPCHRRMQPHCTAEG